MNDKKIKKAPEQKKHIFQIHTMHTDNNEVKTKDLTNSKTAPPVGNKLPKLKQKNISQKKQSRIFGQSKQQDNNPFLSKESTKSEINTKKGSFAPGAQKESVEKINQTPADIAPKKEISQKNPVRTQKKMIHIIMIIFIILFFLGMIGFGVYMLKFNTQTSSNNDVMSDKTKNISVEDEYPTNDIDSTVDNNINNEKVINETKIEDVKSIQQVYSTDLPNYFSIDVENATVKQDILTELQTIRQNIEKQDVMKPISFIVTDQNNNPVSFHVFALSADMDVPQDILSNLEEGFEIYVYNDSVQGVRFGFGIDVKNTQKLQTAVIANEMQLPKAFDIVLDGKGAKVTEVVFKDSSYKTHPIRYYNLDELESYSIDYTINNKRWFIGTTKNTLRAIIDTFQKSQMQDVEITQ